jgi:asparagine synthase (glutamine-hydrolysing)
MCGIAGFIAATRLDAMESIGSRMADTIAHRGPDDAGVWIDRDAGVCLAHRRLAILDLSPTGHQPMMSSSNRFVMSYNGEIYNHLEIRAEIEASGFSVRWSGRSDTETLLAAFERWGVEGALQRAVGMFAIALWDRAERQLTLARDRFGEKPLFYGWVGKGIHRAFVFGSELKALRAYPGFANPISRDTLALYAQHGVLPAPYSIYEDVLKLPSGCVLTLDPGDLARQDVTIEPYWRLTDTVLRGLEDPFRDASEAVDALNDALLSSVAQQAVADVPLGAFLSGGVDSSTIVALMQAQSSRPVRTFTVGFDEAGFNEADQARAVARHLGTDHHEIRVTSADALAVIPRLPALYDEPFADSSQIPTHLVCQCARSRVTVALSGDGGDELFGGYNRHSWGGRVWAWLGWLSPPVRQAIGATIHGVPRSVWNGVGQALPGGHRVALLGDKAHKLADRLHSVRGVEDLYRSLVTQWPTDARLVEGAGRLPTRLDDAETAKGVLETQNRMMLWDALTYLQDDILTKVDRAAMGASLETRIPFLDHRVFQLAWRLPLDMKIRPGESKWALRQVLYRYVPRQLIVRPKAGFAVPVGEWLRGPLRDWAEDLLDETRLSQEGYFNTKLVRAAWSQHLSERYEWTSRLWTVLMFQAWLAANAKPASGRMLAQVA